MTLAVRGAERVPPRRGAADAGPGAGSPPLPPAAAATVLDAPRDVIRADLTADVLATAGEEERFPWRLAPVRAVAIVATVGLGAPMGTESPAAHLGVAAGAWLGDRGVWWRRSSGPPPWVVAPPAWPR